MPGCQLDWPMAVVWCGDVCVTIMSLSGGHFPRHSPAQAVGWVGGWVQWWYYFPGDSGAGTCGVVGWVWRWALRQWELDCSLGACTTAQLACVAVASAL